MLDRYGREIQYLRISVTDRCNFRCAYCQPSDRLCLLRPEELITSEEIVRVARAAVTLGVSKIRVTGGEPLLRPDIVSLISALAGIEGLRELAMSTNGALLAPLAVPLATAGLQRVNVSLDTIDAARFHTFTGGTLETVLAGINAAERAGLTPIKLNCVVESSPDEPDARGVQQYADTRGYRVQFIRRMDLTAGTFAAVIGGAGGDCARCNRLRLSSDGKVRPCLFSDLAFSIRELGIENALLQAVQQKPVCGSACTHDWIRGIGG